MLVKIQREQNVKEYHASRITERTSIQRVRVKQGKNGCLCQNWESKVEGVRIEADCGIKIKIEINRRKTKIRRKQKKRREV